MLRPPDVPYGKCRNEFDESITSLIAASSLKWITRPLRSRLYCLVSHRAQYLDLLCSTCICLIFKSTENDFYRACWFQMYYSVLLHGKNYEKWCRGRGGGGVGKEVNRIKTHVSLFIWSILQLMLGVFGTENITKKNGQLLNKPRIRLLLKNPGATFLQIQTDVYTNSVILVI